MTKVAHPSTTSTDAPQVRVGPRPALPRQKLTADMNPLLRDIDWNGHIPTARQAAGSYTRASLDTAITNQAHDEPRPYDAVVLGWQYDGLQADNAF